MNKKLYKITKGALSLVISSLLIWVLATQISLHLILIYIQNISWLGLSCFTFLSVLGLLLRSYRYKMFLRTPSYSNKPQKNISLHIVLALALRNFVMEFFPFRIGETSILAYLSFIKIKLTESTRALLACLFLDILSLLIFMLLALMGFLFAPGLRQNPNSYLSILIISSAMILALSVFAYLVVYNIKKVGDVLGSKFNIYINKLQDIMPTALKRFRPIRGTKTTLLLLKKTDRSDWIRGLLVSITLRVFKYLSLSILFIDAIGIQSRFSEAIIYHTLLLPICFIISEAVASLPASGLFGFGGYELSFDYSYSLLFDNIQNLTSVVFSVHLVSQIVNLITLVTIAIIAFVPQIAKKLLKISRI